MRKVGSGADEAVHQKGPFRVRVVAFARSVHKNGLSGVQSVMVGEAKRRCAQQGAGRTRDFAERQNRRGRKGRRGV